jgi:PiT family inorganic phosphate transporter
VANGIGPLAAVVSIVQSGGEVSQKAGLPLWILVVGGGGIVVGLATMGYKVMKSIGTRITELTPSRGYCATLAAATVVLASRTGCRCPRPILPSVPSSAWVWHEVSALSMCALLAAL